MPKPRTHRRSRKPKGDQAKEKVVSARIQLELASEWIVTPKMAVGFSGVGEHRIQGYYLDTQMKLLAGSRKDFAKNQTQSAGIPDLLVRLVHWPEWTWIGIELKSEKDGAAATTEQKYLGERNAIIITNEDEEVWNAIFEADERFAVITGKRFVASVPGRGSKPRAR